MVEISIERKKKPIWPWIFLLLLLALLGWAIYELAFDRNEVETDEVSGTTMIIPASEINQLTNLVSVSLNP